MKILFFISCLYLLSTGNVKSYSTNNRYTAANASFPKNIKKIEDTASLNGQWFLQPLFVADTATGKIPVLQLNVSAGSFSGNTGCNTMHGSFQKTDTSLVFNQNLITTKMNCTGYDEAAFIKSLLSTNGYKFDNGMLVLMFDATELSRWTRKPQKKLRMNKA
jgi:heat shock protein HslJ